MTFADVVCLRAARRYCPRIRACVGAERETTTAVESIHGLYQATFRVTSSSSSAALLMCLARRATWCTSQVLGQHDSDRRRTRRPPRAMERLERRVRPVSVDFASIAGLLISSSRQQARRERSPRPAQLMATRTPGGSVSECTELSEQRSTNMLYESGLRADHQE